MEPSLYIGEIGISLVMALVALGSAIGTAVTITAKLTKMEMSISNISNRLLNAESVIEQHRDSSTTHSIQFAQIIERMTHMSVRIDELRAQLCDNIAEGKGCDG